MVMSRLFIFLFLFTPFCYAGDDVTLQRCCDLGAKFGVSPEPKCQYLPKISGIRPEEMDLCMKSMEFCCVRESILQECSSGMNRAKTHRNCPSLNDTDNCSTMAHTCCTACVLAIHTANSGLQCKLPGPLNFVLTQVQENCCMEQEDEDDNDTEDESEIPVNLNLCEKLPYQLCEHICVPTPNSYYCKCRKGFVLMEDQKTCQPEKQKPKPVTNLPINSQILPNPEKPVPLKKPYYPTTNQNTCSKENQCEQICTDTPRGAQCSCRTGYELKEDQLTCRDINECLDNIHVCDPILEICRNEIGSYRCDSVARSKTTETTTVVPRTTPFITTIPTTTEDTKRNCIDGYEKQGKYCVDVDECNTQTHPEVCEPNEKCINTQGSYECRCDTGFTKETPLGPCVDINECQQNSHNCLPEQRCDNTIGSFQCQRLASCGTGYTFNAQTEQCEDDDECALQTDNCRYLGSNYICRNILGSFRCERKRCGPSEVNCTLPRICPNGFKESTIGHCIDVDECREKLHNCNPGYESCINKVGSFECQKFRLCPVGYLASAFGCDDIDECSTGQHKCEPPSECRNHNGGYSCLCPIGYQLVTSTKCEDVNECLRAVCPSTSECENTEGGYRCNCKPGFRQVGTTHCEDQDECSSIPGICEHRCINGYGSYRCFCNSGYQLHENNRSCVDVDECTKFGDSTLCTGQCVNTPGSFACSCPPGYNIRGDGRTCQDIDECLRNPCRGAISTTAKTMGQMNEGTDEVCVNTHGTYTCKSIRCPAGYTKDPDQLNKCRRLPCDNPLECILKPMSYSYNFITFVSMLPIPAVGYIDLFTMRGPFTPNTDTKFEMRLVSSVGPPTAILANREYFHLRNPANNQAAISLSRSIEGPQEIEVQLTATIFHNRILSGKAVANIFIIVSQYKY